MPWNVAAVTTRAGQRRIAVWAVLRRVANGTLADRVVARRRRDLGRRTNVHKTPVTVRALLIVVLAVCHDEA